jgi:Uma2 family endonuclease
MATDLTASSEADLPDHYEVVDGQVVELPPMSGFASEVANRIRDELAYYARASRTGRTRNDMLFRLPLPEDGARNRQPDAAYISFDRWPESRPMPRRGNPVDVVPDVAVEVVSPTDYAEDLFAKVDEYLRAGVRLVWVVFPTLRQVYAFTGPTALRVFGADAELDGGDVLPGFRVPVASLIPPVVPDAE